MEIDPNADPQLTRSAIVQIIRHQEETYVNAEDVSRPWICRITAR